MPIALRDWVTLADYSFDLRNRAERKYIHGDRVDYPACRFCGRVPDNGRRKFRKESHVFPQTLGNNVLFSDEECESCNQRGSAAESDLAEFLAIAKFVSGIRGKNPEFAWKNGGSGQNRSSLRVRPNSDREVNIIVGDPSVRMRVTETGGVLTMTSRKYLYENVARSLARLILFSVPAADLPLFQARAFGRWANGECKLTRSLELWVCSSTALPVDQSAFMVQRAKLGEVPVYIATVCFSWVVIWFPVPFGEVDSTELAPPAMDPTSGIRMEWNLRRTDEPVDREVSLPFNFSSDSRVRVPTAKEIELRAYEIWIENGMPANSALSNWLEAETELSFRAWINAGLGRVEPRDADVP